jgi:N-acetylmuramoyl-L-alanine amidase
MGLKICLDPGHGGNEPGAVASGFTEKDLNLKVAFLMKAELERCGVQVVMTRISDDFVSLSDRAQISKDAGCTSLFSVHFNSNDAESRGAEVIYSFYKQCLDSSRWIAECVLNEVVKLGVIKRGIWTKESGSFKGHNYYGVLRNLEPIPGIIAEGLFLDSVKDIEILKKPNFLKNLAVAYTKGVCTAYGIAFVPDESLSQCISEKLPEPVKSVNPFSDWSSISDYAKEAVSAMKDLGFMVGDATGNFNPASALTRQDFAMLMYKVIKKYNLT